MTAMADRFLREVSRMHHFRRDINEMTPEEADELIRGLAMTRPRTGSLPRAMHNCRRPILIGAGCFLAAAAPANRTQCRQRCILRCALASSAFTSSPQLRPTFT